MSRRGGRESVCSKRRGKRRGRKESGWGCDKGGRAYVAERDKGGRAYLIREGEHMSRRGGRRTMIKGGGEKKSPSNVHFHAMSHSSYCNGKCPQRSQFGSPPLGFSSFLIAEGLIPCFAQLQLLSHQFHSQSCGVSVSCVVFSTTRHLWPPPEFPRPLS